MKQLVMMVMAVFLLASCQETPKGYVINGVVENMPDGKIYLKTFRLQLVQRKLIGKITIQVESRSRRIRILAYQAIYIETRIQPVWLSLCPISEVNMYYLIFGLPGVLPAVVRIRM